MSSALVLVKADSRFHVSSMEGTKVNVSYSHTLTHYSPSPACSRNVLSSRPMQKYEHVREKHRDTLFFMEEQRLSARKAPVITLGAVQASRACLVKGDEVSFDFGEG